MQLLDRGHHPYISTGLGETIVTPLVSVLFMECQMHIMKIKSLIPGTHEPHACKLSLQAYKH